MEEILRKNGGREEGMDERRVEKWKEGMEKEEIERDGEKEEERVEKKCTKMEVS